MARRPAATDVVHSCQHNETTLFPIFITVDFTAALVTALEVHLMGVGFGKIMSFFRENIYNLS